MGTINIDDLTIGQAKQLAGLVGKDIPPHHPCVGKKVLAILPERFIYMGTLEQNGEHYVLNDAQNIRYWKPLKNGLGDLAARGPIDGDKIDICPPVWFRASEEIAFMECRYE